MPNQLIESRPLPRHWESMLSRLQTTLKARDLWNVVDSFPPATSFLSQETTVHDQSAIRLRLGFREQADGVQASSWAYTLINRSDLEPPVLIWDELPLVHVRPGLYRRAASSLLRIAGDLLVPFRFLQSEPHATKNVRNMLCALVLYFQLVNGLTATAIKWANFEPSLVQALEYINNSADYQHWQSHQSRHSACISRISATGPSPTPNNSTDSNNSHVRRQEGGIVCSDGSSISVKPQSNIAKLMHALGDRVGLLDAIPSTPVRIDRQSLFPTYSPFRLYLGKHDDVEVYVYLTQDLKGSTKILAHTGDETLSWKFADLTGIQLEKPFAYIMTLNQDLRTRGNKIRYLVFYYFMLAENEGIIGVPKTQTSFQSMIAPLRSACKNLEEAAVNVDSPAQDAHATEDGDGEEGRPGNPGNSLILKLRVGSDIIAALVENVRASQYVKPADSHDTDLASERFPWEVRVSQAGDTSVEEREEVHEPVESTPSKIDMSRYNAFVEDAEDVDLQTSIVSRTGSRDHSLTSLHVFSASITPGVETEARSPHIEPMTGNSTHELANQKLNDRNIDLGIAKPRRPKPDVTRPGPEKTDDHQRAASHLSISSDEFVDAKEMVEQRSPGAVASRSRSKSRSTFFSGSHIIDLCSGDEDVATPPASKDGMNMTPEIDLGELRWPSSKKRKRRSRILISSDEQDEVLEEVDGGAWKKASRQQFLGL